MQKRVTDKIPSHDWMGKEPETLASVKEMIRVESEETQDCVREALELRQEEAEEISFVPSAISVPTKAYVPV